MLKDRVAATKDSGSPDTVGHPRLKLNSAVQCTAALCLKADVCGRKTVRFQHFLCPLFLLCPQKLCHFWHGRSSKIAAGSAVPRLVHCHRESASESSQDWSPLGVLRACRASAAPSDHVLQSSRVKLLPCTPNTTGRPSYPH